MTKKNILFAHSVAKIGGAEKVTLDIIDGIKGSIYNSHLFVPYHGRMAELAEQLDAKIFIKTIIQQSRSTLISSLIFKRAVVNYLTKNNITIIHTGDIFVARALMPAAKAMNIRMICHMHFPPDDGALKWVCKLAPSKLEFIYCSQELHDNVQPRVRKLLPNAQHKVIHNCVDIRIFTKTQNSSGLLLTDAINIGIVANLQERKGHKEFIESAAELIKRHDNLAFHIIGGDVFGEQRYDMLKKEVDNLGLSKNITFHGQVENVRDYLNELDIYVCSSYEEAFPISILEAMSMQLPIASTNVNGIPEALKDNYNALLYNPKEPLAQAEAINKFLKNPRLREKLAINARKDVEARFSKQRFLENIDHCYRTRG